MPTPVWARLLRAVRDPRKALLVDREAYDAILTGSGADPQDHPVTIVDNDSESEST